MKRTRKKADAPADPPGLNNDTVARTGGADIAPGAGADIAPGARVDKSPGARAPRADGSPLPPSARPQRPEGGRAAGGRTADASAGLPGLFDDPAAETILVTASALSVGGALSVEAVISTTRISVEAAEPEAERPAPGSRGCPLTVAELNLSVQQSIESGHPNVWIVGEISNLSRYASGHFYFTLKDGGSEIAAVMFAGANKRLKFSPGDGLAVLARGRPTLWVPRGRYQFIVEEMEPRGRGSLLEAFEALKQRLLTEGLFDSARKRPIPMLPSCIGVVTSPDGAALRDILKVLMRRHAGVDVLIAPVRVQGEGAAEEIALAIEAMGRIAKLDVLIVGRGGGSIEDLWAFNEERVARAICSCPIPVISAVGHETDVTIADFAADVRAATPSHAAELVVASRQDLAERLAAHRARLAGAARWRLGEADARLDRARRASALARFPATLSEHGQVLDDTMARILQTQQVRLDAAHRASRELALRLAPRHLLEVVRRRQESVRSCARRLTGGITATFRACQGRADAAADLLRSLSPLNVLDRGYAICTDPTGRVVLRTSDDVGAGDSVLVRLSRGALDCRVLASRPPKEEPS